MRVIAVVLALLLAAGAGLAAAVQFRRRRRAGALCDLIRADAPWAILALAVLFFLLLLVWRPSPPPRRASVAPSASAQARQRGRRGRRFLGLLQEKGRFVDFLMGDVGAFSDAEVGAAGRVLHEGCKAVLASISASSRCARRARAPRSRCRRAMRRTIIASSGASAARRRSPARWSITAGGPNGSSCRASSGTDPDKLPAIAPAEVELG